jgi:oligosaccharyltransferase complex subunit gamma
MRLSLGLSALLAAPLLLLSGVQASAADHAAKWAAEAASSTDGIINVDTAGYDAILQGDPDEGRTYGVTVVLTALPEQYKCTPCHEFAPVYHRVADSWSRVTPKATRDKHFFVSLDFSAGQGIFQRLGLSSAPTVYYYPPTAGPRAKNGDTAPQHYDLNRA